MSRLEIAFEQIRFARGYTERLLAQIDSADWFRMAGSTHVAWQVGHLTLSQYRLGLERIRGPQPEDTELVPQVFVDRFGRTSVPDPDAVSYPSVIELRDVFDRVNRRLLEEHQSGRFSDIDLDEPLSVSHAICRTKGDALFWCSHHEMLHAGQIGLIRRGLGYAPVW